MHKKLLVLAVFALSAVMMATPVTGSFSFTPSNLSTYSSPSGAIGNATSITIPANGSVIFGGGTGYFDPTTGTDPVANGSSVTLNPTTFYFSHGSGVYLVGHTDLLIWNGANSTFTSDKMFVDQTQPGGSDTTGSLTVHFYGQYTDTANNFQSTGELIFSGPQFGATPSDKANFTGTFNIPGATPPPAVPEPATVMLMGTALIGFGLLRRARS